jgi:rhodanese-related sulfurtransferase
MITPDSLAALLRDGAPHALLDLRERAAFERGHIFRATPLPRRLLEIRLPALVSARATPIAAYDDDGRLSALARPTIEAMGYTDVRLLAGGLAAWRQAGHPVVQGVNLPSKVFGERVLHERKTPEILVEELAARLGRGDDLLIVDARTPEEYRRGCIPGAWSVPGGELVWRIADLVPRPDTAIVVHCGGRTRSYIGCESLRRMGLPNPVVALRNGTMGWELAGLALERGARRIPPPPSEESRALAREAARRVAAEDRVRLVSPAALRARWGRRETENVHVLDVRTAEEYAAGHVPGATWAPGGQLVQATDEYVAVRAGAIVLTCDDATRSVMTASWLGRMGFPDVSVLAGGLAAWVAGGGSVESGHPSAVPAGYDAARATIGHVAPGSLRDAAVLCVDPSDAYARGHVPGAGWLCRSRLEWTAPRAVPDRERPVVVTCDDGLMSALAAGTLAGLGYRAVRVLDGGVRAWTAAGLPLEQGATRLLDEPDDVVLKPYDKGRAAMEAYLAWEEALDGEGRSPHALLPDGGGEP